jgi:hypothetical protein
LLSAWLLSPSCYSWGRSGQGRRPSALTKAAAGDEIRVAAGLYTLTLLISPGVTRTASFSLVNGVAIYGGFAATETLGIERDWETNVTVLSSDVDGNDVTDAHGVVTTTVHITGSNGYHVVAGSGVTETAVLDGFTITGGNADGTEWPDWDGGGMYGTHSSNPTLTNVAFISNTAVVCGGWMLNIHSSNPTLTNVTFNGNTATQAELETLPRIGP